MSQQPELIPDSMC